MNRSAIRRLVRGLREIRALGWAVRATDRLWWWWVIRRSGLVDRGFYAAQLGLAWLPLDVAIFHYVARGFRRGLSVNPLFDEVTAGGHLPEVFRVPAMYAYLLSDKETVPIHPLWDAPAYGRGLDRGNAGPLEYAWKRPHAHLTVGIEGFSRSMSVRAFRADAVRHIRHWRSPVRAVQPARCPPARVGVVRVIQKRDRRYARKLAQAARLSSRGDLAVTVAMVSPDASQWAVARLLSVLAPNVRVVGYKARARWESVVADALRRDPLDVVLALDARAEFQDEQVDELLSHAERGFAAMPVPLAMNGTIVGAGASAVSGHPHPYRILSGHPSEDLDGWGADAVEVPLLTGRTLAAPAPMLREGLGRVSRGGSDATESVSAYLRARGIRLVVLPRLRALLEEPEHAFAQVWRRGDAAIRGADEDEAQVEALLRKSSFVLDGWKLSGRRPLPRLEWLRPDPLAQRWAIKICAPPGRAGAVWGDTHFAVGLSRALRRLGHTVVIDAYGASRRDSAYLDDVSVVIRGPYRIDPPDTGVRIEWIISHPDTITASELARFDRVFAASHRWAAEASRRWGVQIEPLLECTDVDQFRPQGLPRGDDIVFVGTARGIARPSVVVPLAAGIPVKVYGPDWRPFIPSSAVIADSIPNSELAARYETASVVLNDQWPAMREAGFIAMRPFDAIAAGGRVISEAVDGIEELFQGAVLAYRDTEHLVELLLTDPDEIFPPQSEILRIAGEVREHHSFDARAQQLISVAELMAPSQRGMPVSPDRLSEANSRR